VYIIRNSFADALGLINEDIILEINGVKIDEVEDVAFLLK